MSTWKWKVNDVAEWSCDVFCPWNGGGVCAGGGGDGGRAGGGPTCGGACDGGVDCCGVG